MPKTVSEVFAAASIMEILNADPEFRLHSRYWQGILEFGVDDRTYVFNLRNGKVISANELSAQSGASRARDNVRISAPSATWAIFLQDPPPPFYQDYYCASLHYDFELSGDPETLWAYYPAIRRTHELLRDIARGEASL